jgi:5,10-methylenetetrahydromethanopterin reductase
VSDSHKIRGSAEISRGPLARRFGIGLRGNLAPAAYGRLGLLAEELGLDVVSAFHDLGDQPAFVPLLEVAKVTRRVALGPACLNPYTMQPVEIASAMSSLNDASGGRAYLGLARGAWLDTLGFDQRDAVARVRAAAEFVRSRLNVPLLVGGWGRRMVALAGEIAQELKVGGSANPELVPVMREWLGGSRTGIVLGAVTVVDEDGNAARARARAAVQHYFELVAPFDPTIAGPLDRISDELLDRFTFAGTPEDVARHVDQVFAAGASRVEFGAPFGLDHERGLRLLGERVIPLARGE